MRASFPGLVLVILLAFAAASANAAAPAGPPIPDSAAINRSGPRIKRWVAHAPDGASWNLGWLFDSKLNASCSPRLAADGKTRCLPSGSAYASDFADPDCRVAVVSFRVLDLSTRDSQISPASQWKETRYASRTETRPSSGESATRIFRLGAPYSGPLFRRDGSGACAPSASYPEWSDRYLLGPEIPAAEFVEASESVASRVEPACAQCCLNQSGTRLQRKVARAADGAAVPVPWLYDSLLKVDCSSTLASDGTLRCLPHDGISPTRLFADPICTIRLAVGSTFGPGKTGNRVVGRIGSPASGTREPAEQHIFPITGEHHGPVFGDSGSASCVEMRIHDERLPSGTSMSKHWTLGPEIPPDQYALLSEKVLDRDPASAPEKAGCLVDPTTRSGSRLRLQVVRGPDQSSYAQVHPFDTALGVDCSVARASDGKQRCLPAVAVLGFPMGFYSDSSCEVPVVPMSGTEASPAPALVREDKRFCPDRRSSSCPEAEISSQVHVYRLGLKHSGPVFRRDFRGGCIPNSSEPRAFYSVGPEVPSHEFLEVTAQLE